MTGEGLRMSGCRISSVTNRQTGNKLFFGAEEVNELLLVQCPDITRHKLGLGPSCYTIVNIMSFPHVVMLTCLQLSMFVSERVHYGSRGLATWSRSPFQTMSGLRGRSTRRSRCRWGETPAEPHEHQLGYGLAAEPAHGLCGKAHQARDHHRRGDGGRDGQVLHARRTGL